MKKLLTGNSAVSYGVMLSRAEVISAYPITPQTTIVEELSEICSDGRLKAKFIRVESEHSALACVSAACATGARVFTATSSHGLAYMHEMLHWTSGTRLPVVMVNANRAIGSPWNIWCDHSDSLSQRDTGWIQLYCQSAQEALDTVIQAYRIAEEVLLPVMVLEDGFFLSHTSDTVDVPEQKEVDAFLPPYRPRYKLDPADPHTFNIMADPALFISFKHEAQKAMDEAQKAILRVDREFKSRFGRSYGYMGKVHLTDADVVLLTMGTAASTALEVIEAMRKQGKKVGLCRLRMFRPFPQAALCKVLSKAKKIAVLDRDNSLGAGGIVAQELKAALYNLPRKPKVFEFIAGLGGRDITPSTIQEILEYTIKNPSPNGLPVWMGVQK
ncbi:MAG: pyruvate ferredoxin oxidoreductase [Deltaproteobacteria bacterium]|nr:pyruvate ferredoxin oxidoreductase [Deltaproteobacteria bacterium]